MASQTRVHFFVRESALRLSMPETTDASDAKNSTRRIEKAGFNLTAAFDEVAARLERVRRAACLHCD